MFPGFGGWVGKFQSRAEDWMGVSPVRPLGILPGVAFDGPEARRWSLAPQTIVVAIESPLFIRLHSLADVLLSLERGFRGFRVRGCTGREVV